MNGKYILTASHCTDKTTAENIFVRVGAHNIKEDIPKEQIYSVKKIHSMKFKGTQVAGDIAILELKNNITFIEDVVEKGCFNLDEKEYPNEFLAAGWGMTQTSYIDPKTKQWVLNGQPDKLKQTFYKQMSPCKDFLICLEPVTEGNSVCQGDSGGPIHYTENGITKVEGVASFVSGTKKIEDLDHYCVGKASYSRLSYYADWISKTAEYDFCGTHERKKFLGLF